MNYHNSYDKEDWLQIISHFLYICFQVQQYQQQRLLIVMSADFQAYTKISETFKQMVTTLTTKQLPFIKLYLSNLNKKIAAGDDKFLSEFKNVTQLLNSLKEAKGKVAMHYITASGNIETLKFLIQQYKIDIQVKDKQGNGALFTAVEHGNLPMVRYLVEQLNVSVFTVKDGNIGVLHIAANTNNVQMLEYFIAKGCDIEKLSIYGKPINWAVGSRNIEATNFLLQHGADANGDLTCPAPPPLILAVDFECQQIYEALLNAPKPASILVKDPQGYSLLHLAAQKGNLKLVKQLIEKKLSPNQQVEGKTPLSLAFFNHKFEVVSQLKKYTKNTEQILKKLEEQQNKKQNPVPVDKSKAEAIKIEGNKYFVENKYSQARSKYLEAIVYDPDNDAINRNLAACNLHLNQYQDALLYCHKAKIIDPKNVKNLYREAQAYIGLGNLVDAASSLWECAMLEPNNAFFRQEFQKYVELAKQQHKSKEQE